VAAHGPASLASRPLARPGPRRYGRVLGVGAYRPRRLVTNAEICRTVSVREEWIVRRTGIRARRIAGPDEPLPAMAAAAASKALASAGVTAADVGCVLVATVSHLYQAPSAAAEVAGLLGLARPGVLDLSAACAGFCYALALADQLVGAGVSDYVLVIGAERMSDIIDPSDRSTAFIFGDGAGAAVIGPSDDPGIGPVVWGSDPTGLSCIAQPRSWLKLRDDPAAVWPYLRMSGTEVYRWATGEMASVARLAMERAGVTPADLAAFVPHQANLRICAKLASSLRLPPQVRLASDVVDAGNTSAASIPLALDRMIALGEIPSGGLALLIGFGSGLTYAAQVIRVP
jgi:3-oxoacyl-[acyl-carrier-protein] synthase III